MTPSLFFFLICIPFSPNLWSFSSFCPQAHYLPFSAYMGITWLGLANVAVIDIVIVCPSHPYRTLSDSRPWLAVTSSGFNLPVSQWMDESFSVFLDFVVGAGWQPCVSQRKNTQNRPWNDFIPVYSHPSLGSWAWYFLCVFKTHFAMHGRCRSCDVYISRGKERGTESGTAYSMWTLLTDLKRLIQEWTSFFFLFQLTVCCLHSSL